MNGKKVIIWNNGIADLIRGKGSVGGLTVQLYFWAKTFVSKGWNVYSFISEKETEIENIRFIHATKIRYIDVFINPLWSLFVFLKIRPNLILFRGADRNLLWVSWLAKLFGSKCVFMNASDVNFVPGKDWIAGGKMNTKLYRRSIKNVSYFVTQNSFQQECLFNNYKKKSIVIPNIWIDFNDGDKKKLYDVLWVANMRRLKRPEWFINTAKSLPEYSFAMVGGVFNGDVNYYDKIKKETENIGNLTFLGSLDFYATNRVFCQSRLVVCTSEYEGFPNTFLQAWANEVPVISTVDPSDMIKSFNLGKSIDTEDELFEAFVQIHENDEWYKKCQTDIASYFYTHHDADMAYDKVIHYLEIK